MASKVTNEDIVRINELYYKYKTYAEVARQTGFSAGTVKKYVIANWQPVIKENIIHFDLGIGRTVRGYNVLDILASDSVALTIRIIKPVVISATVVLRLGRPEGCGH